MRAAADRAGVAAAVPQTRLDDSGMGPQCRMEVESESARQATDYRWAQAS